MARRPRKPVGFKQVEANLKKAMAGVVTGAKRGMVKGALIVERDSKLGVPVRTGNLRSSGFTLSDTGTHGIGASFTGPNAGRVAQSDTQDKNEAAATIAEKKARGFESVAVGHTAPYAIFVHENARAGAAGYDSSADVAGLRADRVHSKVGGWKFLENSIKANTSRIIALIKSESKL